MGAGPVGSTLALLLARRGLRSLLVDKSEFPRDKPCGEGLLPGGVRVLQQAGFDAISTFPLLRGVRYRVEGTGTVATPFRRPGRGVRRLVLDSALVELARRDPRIRVQTACSARGFNLRPEGVELDTSEGAVRTRYLVGADGLGSWVARQLGWSRRPRPAHRFGLVGHVRAPAHGRQEIEVSLLPEGEVYVAPTAPDELLAAVLLGRDELRPGDARDLYLQLVGWALGGTSWSMPDRLRGAGPFHRRPRQVAAGRVFLVGDAAGFIDALTGDGMAAGLAAAACLASLLADVPGRAATAYSTWHRQQWRRRRLITAIALSLCRWRPLTARAVTALERRPRTLEKLVALNEGEGRLRQLGWRDWAALAGF